MSSSYFYNCGWTGRCTDRFRAMSDDDLLLSLTDHYLIQDHDNIRRMSLRLLRDEMIFRGWNVSAFCLENEHEILPCTLKNNILTPVDIDAIADIRKSRGKLEHVTSSMRLIKHYIVMQDELEKKQKHTENGQILNLPINAPVISSQKLTDLSEGELNKIADQMYDRIMAQRKQILTAKIEAMDISHADLSKLTDGEIAVCVEHETLKSRTIPGDETPLPDVVGLGEALSRMRNGVFRYPVEYRIPPQKNRIVPPEKMESLDQQIRKAKIEKRVRDKMDNTSNPYMLSHIHNELIPGTNTYYMCKYFSYKQQSTLFHMAFSHEFVTNSRARKEHGWDQKPILGIIAFLRKFFDIEYILKNKKKIFKHPEYFLVFTNGCQSEYDICCKQLIEYLSISKKRLKNNRNLVSLWSSFPSLSRVIDPRRGAFRQKSPGLDFLKKFYLAVIKHRKVHGDPEWFKNGETRTLKIIE